MRKHLLVVLLVVSVAANLALLLPLTRGTNAAASPEVALNPKDYPFLAKRILVDNPNEVIINFSPLRSQLARYASESGHKIGIYFQYLPTGIAVGIGENEPFVSASLLKLPTAMKVYRLIQEGRLQRNQVLRITPEVYDTTYGSLWRKGLGANITLNEALEYSLRESDNTAHRMLFFLSEGRPDDIYKYLDVELASVDKLTAISPRNYSSILRSLYYSAYLSFPNSNEVLSHLSNTTNEGILRGGIPANVKIAQKIGVYGTQTSVNRVYSFCGIFYVPLRPYTLCIMTSTDPERAITEAGEISTLVHEYLAEPIR